MNFTTSVFSLFRCVFRMMIATVIITTQTLKLVRWSHIQWVRCLSRAWMLLDGVCGFQVCSHSRKLASNIHYMNYKWNLHHSASLSWLIIIVQIWHTNYLEIKLFLSYCFASSLFTLSCRVLFSSLFYLCSLFPILVHKKGQTPWMRLLIIYSLICKHK